MSTADFESKISSEIQERLDILREIEIVLFTKRYKLSRKHLDIFSVQSINMIYSIWEGFIQRSFQIYVDELNSLGIKFKDFSDEIKILHMEKTFRQFKQYPKDDKVSSKVNFYDKLSDFFSIETRPIYRIVNTESNVSFDTLNSILESFCLETFSPYWENYRHPRPNLKETLDGFLRYRNGVAHGGDISSEEKVTQEVYTKYKTLVTDLMYATQKKMMDGLDKKTYLKVK